MLSNAESVQKILLLFASSGTVTGFETNFPQRTRFDNCLYKGLEVTPDFDPMVDKLVTKGITRQIALRKMKAALSGLLIEGLKTNVPLHKVILENQKFIDGNYSTKFIEKKTSGLCKYGV